MAKSKTNYKRRYYKKSKYASNIIDIGPSEFVLNQNGWNFTEVTLVTNPAYSPTTTSSISKVKNVEVAMNFDCTSIVTKRDIENLQFYIVYVPEGMYVGNDYIQKHPEFIMAMRYYGEPSGDNDASAQSFVLKIKSRLARNLNTGDKIILYIRGANVSLDTSYNIGYGGICRWWTKTN